MALKSRKTAWSNQYLEPRLLLAGDTAAAVSDSIQTDIAPSQEHTSNIVFIDPTVPDLEAALGSLNADHEIVLLHEDASGIQQITEVLNERRNVQSVHLISHGASGQIRIGNQVVDESTLVANQQQIQSWSKSLTDDADLILYGCETALGSAGEQFISRLARISGADVAASTDKTGSQALGGDWDLEASIGVVESQLAFHPSIRESYNGVLPITINAAGQMGDELLELHIDGNVAATFQNIGGDPNAGVFQSLSYNANGISPGRISLHFVNDEFDPANNIDRNVRVDNIIVDGVTYQTEDASVYSTGTWLAADGISPGFGRGEMLHANGFFQFADSTPTGSTITVRAFGDTGQEAFDLRIDGQTVSSFNVTQNAQDFTFQANQVVTGSQVRVVFTNDAFDAANNLDRNLNVDYIQIDGDTLQTEDPSVYSTGTWTPENGAVVPGFLQSETLHSDGYFQYADSGNPVGSTISIRAAGDTGQEDVELQIDGVTVQQWNAIGTAFQDFSYQASGTVSIDQVRVVFTNDLFDQATGADRNLQVDHVSVDGVIYETESPAVFSTGTWLPSDGITPGYRQSETLHADGYFQYAEETPTGSIGAIALAGNYFSANETDSIVQIPFVRSIGSDGVISVDYTLFSGTATSGSDFVAASGTFSLADGQTSGTLDIALINDEISEGAEDFTITLENQTPGALLLSPRTATIEILDDEDPTGGGGPGEGPVPDIDVQSNVLVDGLIGTTAIDFSPDGSIMYLANTEGKVYVYTNGSLQSQVFLDFTDRVNAPRGLLDIAVHPDFDNNGYIYLAYAYDPPETANYTGLAGRDGLGNRASRVTRVTADASNGYLTIVPNSEVVILGANGTWNNFNGFVDSTVDFDEPPAGILPDGSNLQDFLAADSQTHTVDSLEFGPDGYLYVSNGDGTSYNQVDPRTSRVQDIDNLSGKLLRIDPLTGQGAPDNPFYETNNPNSNRSKVYQYGFRNPFRIAIDDVTGQTYVGDVGWSDWEEINAGGPGDNFGWPYYEGGNGAAIPTIYYKDTPEAQAFYNSNPDIADALLGLNHVDDGIDAIALGDVYYGDDLGAAYQGSLLYAHLGAGIVNAIIFDQAGEVSEIKTIATGYQYLVQIAEGPDGRLYYVDFDDGQVGYWTRV